MIPKRRRRHRRFLAMAHCWDLEEGMVYEHEEEKRMKGKVPRKFPGEYEDGIPEEANEAALPLEE